MLSQLSDVLAGWSVGDTKIACTAAVAAMACTVPGVWLVLRRQSMMGDALSHTALPGIVIATLTVHWLESARWISTQRQDVLHAALFLGAVLIGLATSFLTEFVQRLGRVEAGASLGVVFTWLFAVGLVLLNFFARSAHIDVDCVLFGQLEIVPWQPGIPLALRVNAVALGINLLLLALFYKELKISTFDPSLATTLGISASLMNHALMAATAVTVVAAFKTVGSILIIGLLIAPAAAAKLLTDRLWVMIALALGMAAGCGLLGHLLARTVPPVVFPALGLTEVTDVITSGMVAVVAALVMLAAWLLSPRYGVLGTFVSQMRLTVRIAGDDLLGLLYRLEERQLVEKSPAATTLVAQRLGIGRWLTMLAVLQLRRGGLLCRSVRGYDLTARGRTHARSLVRAHRLWESYLQKHFDLPDDHLHEPAHRAEHFLDERLRDQIAAELDSPDRDPHGRVIPADHGRQEL